MNQIFNTAYFHTVLMFLAMVSNQLSAQLREDITTKRFTLDDQVLEIKKEISGGSTIDLIDATTERVDGICSFDKDKLQTGRAFVFDKVAIMYKNDAASGKEGSLSYNAVVPAELQNALFIINQNGREVLRMPVIDLVNLETSFKASDEYTQLNTLRYLVDDRTITMQLKFPPTVALSGATKHYVHVRLSGVQTSKKAN
jgi:hypothetical protein